MACLRRAVFSRRDGRVHMPSRHILIASCAQRPRRYAAGRTARRTVHAGPAFTNETVKPDTVPLRRDAAGDGFQSCWTRSRVAGETSRQDAIHEPTNVAEGR